MRLLERENIDVFKWNDLVDSKSNTLYSYSWYLDSISENWCILVNKDYTSGIALPYSTRLGVDTLYNPIFGGYSEYLGEELPRDEFARLISNRFSVIQISFSSPLLGEIHEVRKCQLIDNWSDYKTGSQAKSSLKKASKNNLNSEQTTDYQSILSMTEKSLSGKFKGINKESFKRLKSLVKIAGENDILICFEISDSNAQGGIMCLEGGSSILYLKGAVNDSVKSIGGMYLALSSAIEYAKSVGKRFDFGGSNADGVRKFNHNLGGDDVEYYHYEINNGPRWYRFSKKVAKKISKK